MIGVFAMVVRREQGTDLEEVGKGARLIIVKGNAMMNTKAVWSVDRKVVVVLVTVKVNWGMMKEGIVGLIIEDGVFTISLIKDVSGDVGPVIDLSKPEKGEEG